MLRGSVSDAGPNEVAAAVKLVYDSGSLRDAVEQMLRLLPFASRPGRSVDRSSLALFENIAIKANVYRGIPDKVTWTRELSEGDRWKVTEHFTFNVVEYALK